MSWKRIVTALAATALLCAPALAGSLGVYGSYWNSDQADNSAGGGGRIGFSFVKFLELDFHGTYYSSFTTDVNGQSVDGHRARLRGLPVLRGGALEEDGDPRQPGVLRQERQVRRHRGQRGPRVALGSVNTRPPGPGLPKVPWGGHSAPLAGRTRGTRAFPQVTEPR